MVYHNISLYYPQGSEYWVPSKKVVFDPTFPEKLCTIDFEEVTKEKVATVTANFLTHPEWDPVSAGMYEFMLFSWIMHPTT